MGFTVRDGNIAVTTLLHMPDHLFHHHQVTEMGVTARHESSQDMKRCFVPDCLSNRAVIPVADYDTPAHEIGHLMKFGYHRID